MNNKIQIGLLISVLILLNTSCEKVTDYYLGFPLQPDFTENTFEEGMNIFGILRPDTHADFNKSFVYVQQNWPVLEFNDSSFTIIKYADIRLIEYENDVAVDTFHFPLLPPDTLFSDTLYRPAETFIPVPGNTYRLLCTHDNLPLATGETLFPDEPRIMPGSLSVSDKKIQFAVAPDAGIKMLDIYISSDESSGFAGRYVTNDTASTNIILTTTGTGGVKIYIYGYDANLSTYYANSNTSLNFNKYRTTFSTLEEGFGVFGSLNLTELTVEIP